MTAELPTLMLKKGSHDKSLEEEEDKSVARNRLHIIHVSLLESNALRRLGCSIV